MIHRKLQIAVAVVLAGAGVATAQYQVDRSGANDANNRIGSGGRNIPNEQPKPWQMNEDIVYGNVTGGRQFRGNLSTRDARAFRGATAGQNIDDFTRQSAGTTSQGVTTYNTQDTRPYYGDSRAVRPPSNAVQVPGGSGFIELPRIDDRIVDPRLQPLGEGFKTINRPDLFGLPGPIDSQYVPGAVVIPSVAQARDMAGLTDYTPFVQSTNALTPAQLQSLQQELSVPAFDATLQSRANQALDRNAPGDATAQPGLNNQLQSPAMNDRLNDAVAPTQLNNAVSPEDAPEVGVRHRLLSAADQSPMYKLLQERRQQLEQQTRPGQANIDAAQQFNADMKARRDAEQNKATGSTTPGSTTPGSTTPGATTPGTTAPDTTTPDTTAPGTGDAGQDTPPVVAPTPGETTGGPVQVGSLAGDQKTGLNELLKRAEAQLADGKFSSAIDTYEQAAQVAPNNPLIKLGRTHAELAGGYYRRAEASLRQTLSADKNLLMGQYDLKSLVGEQRLQTIEQDLKNLIQRNEAETGPTLLLAYLYYNTGNERRAAALLDLADKRAAGKDPLIKTLKQNWSLPEPEPVDLNK